VSETSWATVLAVRPARDERRCESWCEPHTTTSLPSVRIVVERERASANPQTTHEE